MTSTNSIRACVSSLCGPTDENTQLSNFQTQNYLKILHRCFPAHQYSSTSSQFYRFKGSENKCGDSLAHVYLKQLNLISKHVAVIGMKLFPNHKAADREKIYSLLTFGVSTQFELRSTVWLEAMHIKLVEMEDG